MVTPVFFTLCPWFLAAEGRSIKWMWEAWFPSGPAEKDTACLDLSRNQSLREQRVPKGDQDLEEQGGLGSQVDLALPSQLGGLGQVPELK